MTLAGAPAPGLGVTFAKARLACFFTPRSAFGPTARTDQSGRFELIVNEPGNYVACVGDGKTRLPMREFDIPDTDFHVVELAVEETAVAGIVVDQTSGEPIAQARVEVISKDGPNPHWWVETEAGPDGRFRMGAFAEGECVLKASAKGYARGKLEVSLPPGGDLRVALTRASTIKGRVVDADGHGVGGVSVVAREPKDDESGNSKSLQDGSFEIGSLSPAPYNLCAGSALTGFAVGAEVSPGQEDVLLMLSPPGHVRLTVRGPDGAPFVHASAVPRKVDGLVIGGCSNVLTEPDSQGSSSPNTSDSNGLLEVATPVGIVELKVYDGILVTDKDTLEATVTLTVTEGRPAVAAVQLAVAPKDH